MLAILKPFLSPVTRNKIHVINNRSELLQYYDPECLLKCHGGTSDFEYVY